MTKAGQKHGRFVARPAQRALIALSVLVGLAWGAYLWCTGIGLARDSCVFAWHALTAADQVAFSCPPNRAPLYPILLAVATRILTFPTDAAAALAGVTLALAGAVLAGVFLRMSGSALASALLLASFFVSPALAFVYSRAMTEPLYGLFAILWCWSVLRHRQTQQMRYYAAAALAVGAALLTRYAGLALLAVLIAYSIERVWRSRTGRARLVWSYAAWLAVSLAPLAAYLVRNQVAFHTWMGERGPTERTFGQCLAQAVEVLHTDLGPWLLAAAGLSGVVLVLRRRAAAPAHVSFIAGLAAAALLAHVLLVVYSAARSSIDPVNTRYFSTLYFHLLLVIAAAYGHLSAAARAAESSRGRRMVRLTQLALVVLVLTAVGRHAWPAWLEVNRPLVQRDQSLGFLAPGCNLDPALAELRAALAQELSQHEELGLLVLVAPTTRPDLGAALLMRRPLVNGSGLSGACFDDVQRDGYRVRLRWHEQRRTIRYLMHARVPGSAELVRILSRAAARLECQRVLLIAVAQPRSPDEFPGGTLESLSTRALTIRERLRTGVYRLYECIPARPAAVTSRPAGE